MRRFLALIGGQAIIVLAELGEVALLSVRTMADLFTRPPEVRLIVAQIVETGVRSLIVVLLTGIAIGMVLALQTAVGLVRFGAELYVGIITSLAIVREIGPVLTAIVVGGRVGAGIAAEIGSMQVTEQIDAMRALGASPVHKLVVPRVVAIMLVLPLLTVIADVIGIFGGLLVSLFELDINVAYYMNSVLGTVGMGDFWSGIGKSFFFAYLIGIIACYQGFRTTGGTRGVGRSTTQAVVLVMISIILSDFLLTKIFLVLFSGGGG